MKGGDKNRSPFTCLRFFCTFLPFLTFFPVLHILLSGPGTIHFYFGAGHI